MEYGINIEYLTKGNSLGNAVNIISKAGFSVVDYTPDFMKDNWKDEMYKSMELFEKAGLTVHQTHAPMNRYGKCGENHKMYLDRVIEATKIMGAKYMAIHGDEFDFKNLEYTPEKALKYNYELFAPFIDKCAGDNFKFAFETVFVEGPERPPRFTSDADDLLTLIEKFDAENVCCCWDFGHAGIAFEDKHSETILKLGKYIECTHVQDCGHHSDLHLPPFLGDIDWEKCMKAFNSIGYKGNLVFEMVYGTIPDTLTESFSLHLKKTADHLDMLMKNA